MGFCTQKCTFGPEKNKKFVLFTLKMKFLPKYFTKKYKFWIKTVVLYPFGPEKQKNLYFLL